MRVPWRLLGGSLAMAILLGVFFMYGRPDFLVQMANQIWACF